MAAEKKLYEIVEIKYQGAEKISAKVDFLGTMDEAKNEAVKAAKKNIGVRYAVYPREGFMADFQVFYRTTIKCPKCGEVIPIE